MKRSGIWFKGISLAGLLVAATVWAAPVTREKVAAELKRLSPTERAQLKNAGVDKKEKARNIAGGQVDTKGSMTVSIPALPGRAPHEIDYHMTRNVKKGGSEGHITLHDKTTGITSKYSADEETGKSTIRVRGATITIEARPDGTYVVQGQLYPTIDDAAAAIVLMEPMHTGVAPEDLVAVRELLAAIRMESKSEVINVIGGIVSGVSAASTFLCKTFRICI